MQEYVHYGNTEFDLVKVRPISNKKFPSTKPVGGLWASPVGATYGWEMWCLENEYELGRLKTSFSFSIKPNANVFHIHSKNDLEQLPKLKNDIEFVNPVWYIIDFEQAVKDGIDAIEFHLSDDYNLYFALYGWDCDSILILNPDIIVTNEE